MKALERWAGWINQEGRKVPKDARSGRAAKTNNAATWCGWDDACRWYERHQKSPKHGVGFMLKRGDGLVFIDVDDCLHDDGQTLKTWAKLRIEPLLPYCYAERSPGGRGLHLFLIGTFPPGTEKSGATWKVDPNDKKLRDSIAVFDDRRYSTITGDVYSDQRYSPARECRTLQPAQAQLDALLVATGLMQKLGGPVEAHKEREDGRDPEEVMADVKRALEALHPDISHDDWVKVGMALKSEFGDDGFKVWDEWSKRGLKYKSGETRVKWASFTREGVGIGSLFFVAEDEAGFTLRTSAEEDFAAFKNLPEDEELEPEYEEGTLAKWKECKLILVSKGTGKNSVVRPSEGEANIGLYLERHPRWKGQLRYNERTCEVDTLDGEPPNLHKLGRYLTAFMGWRTPSEDVIQRAVTAVAKEHPYDPVREWLRDLKWDHQKRIDGLFAALGLEDTELTKNHLRRWMIGAVARAFKPGCRVQTMLVLHGPQGKKKSDFFRRMARLPEWYSESEVDMRTKDGQVALLGPWIVENAELDGMSKADVSRVKAFIRDATSRFREPYARKATMHPRRCVLGGTTNETEFLRDSTGSRSFWLAGVVGELHVELLDEAMVEQLWAEAVAAFVAGERWWDEGIEVDLVSAANEEHYEGTALDGYVQAVLVELQVKAVTTLQEVTLRLAEKFRLPPNTRGREIGAAVKRAGWSPSKLRVAGTQRRFWVCPSTVGDNVTTAAEQAHQRVAGSEFPEEPA